MKRSRFWVIGAVVAAGGGAVFIAGQMRRPPAPSYESLAVDRGAIVSRISASGAVSARTTVLVGSQVSGRLAEIHVDFNSEVKQGQLLARIDPRLFEAGVEQARANLIAAKAQLARARAQSDLAARDLERKRVLAERRLIATVDLDTSRSQADVAAAEVQAASGSVAQATANLRQAEINLAMTDIVSPIDGVVISRDVDVGQTVAASLQAPTLFTLAADLRQMQVDTDVAESDVARIEAGKSAEFTVDAYPGRTFQGTIREIRNAPKNTQNVVTYNAVIDVDNPDLALKPGMTASVSFVLASREDVLRLPNAALRYRPSGKPSGSPGAKAPAMKKGPPADGERQVWLDGPEGARPVRVKLGITDGTRTEIVSGDVNEGDLAIVDESGAGGAPRGPGGPGGMRMRMF